MSELSAQGIRLARAAAVAASAGFGLSASSWTAASTSAGLVRLPGGASASGVACAVAAVALLVMMRRGSAWAVGVALAAFGCGVLAVLDGFAVLAANAHAHRVTGPGTWLGLMCFVAATWFALLTIGVFGDRARARRRPDAEVMRARERLDALTLRPRGSTSWAPIDGDPLDPNG